MPMLEVTTNIPKEKVTTEVLTNLSKLLSETLGKSESVCNADSVTIVYVVLLISCSNNVSFQHYHL